MASVEITSSGDLNFSSDTNIVQVKDMTSEFALKLDTSNLTADRSFIFPDATGTATQIEQVVMKETLVSVDGTQTGVTLIFEAAADLGNFYPTQIVISPVAIDTVISVATLSVGSDDPSYKDVLSAVALTNLTTVDKFTVFDVDTIATAVPPSGRVCVNILTGAVATSYVLKIVVLGFYDK